MNLLPIFAIIFSFICNAQCSSPFPKIIWLYWSSGQESLPITQKSCYDIMKQYAKSSGWEIKMVTQKNMFQYIPKQQYDQFVQGRVQFVTQQQTADFVRLTLVYEHGGVYFDVASVLVQDLKWLQQISINQDVINKYGQQPDILLFYLDLYQSNQFFYYENGRKGMVNPGFQPWFIASKPKSELMRLWRETFIQLVVEDQEYFRRFRQQNDLYYRNCDDGKMIQFPILFWSTDVYLYVSEALYSVLQKKQKQLDRQIGLFSSNRKYAVNQFKLWTINAYQGPYSFALRQDPRDNYGHFLNLANKRYSEFQFDSQGKKSVKYFVKLNGQIYPLIQNYLKNDTNLLAYERFSYYSCTYYNQCNRTCDHHLYILKDSFVDKYLINDQVRPYINVKILDEKQFEQMCVKPAQFFGIIWTLQDKYYYFVMACFFLLVFGLVKKYYSFDQKMHQY